MNILTEFHVGECYTNDQIRLSLGLENLGGIRPSIDSKRNLVHLAVLTALEDSPRLAVENPYHDRIEGDVLLYTAQGREGDQHLSGRNKRLTEQYEAPIPFYGFTSLGRQTYRFLGLLELIRHYQERQADKTGRMRKVWLFEFHIHERPAVVPIDHASTISASLIAESRTKSSLSFLEREVSELEEPEAASAQTSSLDLESVRSSLFQVQPYRFEYMIRHIMEVNGFRDVAVTAQSGDSGIDLNGYIGSENEFFSGTHVQVQVKRWRHAVGSVEINHFRGALSTTAKGLFITTGPYTRAAIVEANHPSKLAISFIDGPRLASMVLRDKIDLKCFV